jgi:signal transduction histidine kinase
VQTLNVNETAQDSVESTVSPTVPASTPSKPVLLIVDDEEGPRQSIRFIFKDDFEILMADNGPDAIELARSNRVDVAVLDIRMTGMSGIELLERLRFVDPAIKAVMVTAFETTDTMRQALRLRACDYINKPFDVATLRNAVTSALHLRMVEREVKDDARQLQQLLGELQDNKIEEQLARTRGDIYASIIHDINGPLAIVSGTLQLINRRMASAESLDPAQTQFVRDQLKTITRQTGNCQEISRRSLALIKGQSHGPLPVAINPLLSDVEHLVANHPSLHNNRVLVHPLPEDAHARIHGTDVIQMLLNLTVNALQCTSEPHDVTIEGRLLPDPIALESFKDSATERFIFVESFENRPPVLALSVRDTGSGIPPETLPKIFQPFFTTKGPREGTGLGLNIVQRLVKQNQGSLHVQTKPGTGTTFTIYLPA